MAETKKDVINNPLRDDLVTKVKYGFKRIEYNPNVIHNPGKCEVILVDDSFKQYTEPSVTDKEAYRVTLASIRGVLSKGNVIGTPNVASYSIPAGKEYNADFDMSYLRRKDLTIVDIDNYINDMKARLEEFDGELKVQVENQIKEAEALKVSKQKQSDSSDSSDSE